MTSSTDSLGRATFHHIAPRGDVRPTARDIRWLKHIERHGPQSSVYLHELTRETHRCKDTALRQMQKLRAGGYLALPRQQRAAEHADFNPYVYDLTPKTRRFLAEQGLAESTIRPTGHWWHVHAVACVTSSIDISAARDGVRYIPVHELLARRNATLAIPVGRKKLVPDQLFALDYGGRYRVCALEVDRGTEPKTSPASRKSWATSLDLYRQVIERGIHKSHYGLSANLLVLWVFSEVRNTGRFLDLVDQKAADAGASILAQTSTPPAIHRARADLSAHHWTRAWERAGHTALRLCDH